MMPVLANLTDLRDGQSGIIVDISTVPIRRTRRRKGQNGGIIDIDTLPIKGKLDKDCETCEFQQNEACEKLSTENKSSCVQRLMDLGLTPGTKVVVVKSAPFKGPLEVLVRGSRIALGREIASRITVEVMG